MPTQIRVAEFFPTRVLITTLPEIDNEKLLAVIHSLHDGGFTITGKRAHCEQTQGNLMAVNHPAIAPLRDAFVSMIHSVTHGADRVMQVFGWANIMRQVDPAPDEIHNHLPFHWAGVYYVRIPALKGTEGHLVLHDPRDVFAPGKPVVIPPQTGMLVMFPAWLKHQVLPVTQSGEERVAIAMNAVCGLSAGAPMMQLPHRMKKRVAGDDPAQQFDPESPAEFPYPM
jgi:hypothetical protein